MSFRFVIHPKQQMPKRPKLRINTGVLSDGDESECCPDESDGS